MTKQLFFVLCTKPYSIFTNRRWVSAHSSIKVRRKAGIRSRKKTVWESRVFVLHHLTKNFMFTNFTRPSSLTASFSYFFIYIFVGMSEIEKYIFHSTYISIHWIKRMTVARLCWWIPREWKVKSKQNFYFFTFSHIQLRVSCSFKNENKRMNYKNMEKVVTCLERYDSLFFIFHRLSSDNSSKAKCRLCNYTEHWAHTQGSPHIVMWAVNYIVNWLSYKIHASNSRNNFSLSSTVQVYKKSVEGNIFFFFPARPHDTRMELESPNRSILSSNSCKTFTTLSTRMSCESLAPFTM